MASMDSNVAVVTGAAWAVMTNLTTKQLLTCAAAAASAVALAVGVAAPASAAAGVPAGKASTAAVSAAVLPTSTSWPTPQIGMTLAYPAYTPGAKPSLLLTLNGGRNWLRLPPPPVPFPVRAAASGHDSPAGFWYGTDSATMNVSGPAPYQEPVIGGAYGGYIGMTGNWANLTGCHKIVVWSAANSARANNNYTWHHKGIGTGVYYFMGGPGVDPHYNGTAGEAYAWGERQAARTLMDISHVHVKYPVAFADIELPGNAPNYTPAPDNGWKTVYTSPCSGKPKAHGIPTSVDRAVLDGFAAYLTSHSAYKAGVYSAPDIWAKIFGTGSDALIPNTYEWTYESFTSSLAHHPSGWCLSGTSTCARFFGGQTSASKYALMWQWSGGGGSYNGYGDFDQIDGNRTP